MVLLVYFCYVAGLEPPHVGIISVGHQYELRTSPFSFKFTCSLNCDGQSMAFIEYQRKTHKLLQGREQVLGITGKASLFLEASDAIKRSISHLQ